MDRSELEIKADAELLGSYKFGTHVATHHFCKNCGIFTHVNTRLNQGRYRVNLGCIEELELEDLEIEIFDGKSI